MQYTFTLIKKNMRKNEQDNSALEAIMSEHDVSVAVGQTKPNESLRNVLQALRAHWPRMNLKTEQAWASAVEKISKSQPEGFYSRVGNTIS